MNSEAKQKNILEWILCWCLLFLAGMKKKKKKGQGKKKDSSWAYSGFIIILSFFTFALNISSDQWQYFASRGRKG